MYNNDGIAYLTKRPNEIVAAVDLPTINGDVTAFQKLRRRGRRGGGWAVSNLAEKHDSAC
jgi:hypothetical protein